MGNDFNKESFAPSTENGLISINGKGKEITGKTVEVFRSFDSEGIEVGRLEIIVTDMDQKELRLGNLVNHSVLGIVEIIGVGKDYIHCLYNGETHYESINSFFPIPLTEEWLLKFGFISCDFRETYDPNDKFSEDFSYTLDSGLSNREFVCYPYNGWYIEIGQYAQIKEKLKIKFVHHFQNIYFDMTEKELEIK
ncbi:hypothetical protein [Epilithonimonas xixisoli]|uniref:Uncharacterized protein n=1 Tax=Epilithonimonas xixisoli TaxID=1476462 RepID=A0A4R8I5X2_9FLAO|nr:hypothetical protein [Epilithonimonas xixisoli]TDX83969.1 hypothetical protein B0I22_1557 [Epilithonimonas xixisoli]